MFVSLFNSGKSKFNYLIQKENAVDILVQSDVLYAVSIFIDHDDLEVIYAGHALVLNLLSVHRKTKLR